MVLVVYRHTSPLKAHADVSNGDRDLNTSPNLYLQSNFVYTVKEGVSL